MTAIRRNLKNVVHNYSDAKVKVREATSNDPWGPSSTLMAEIAEMTYNVMAYSEIMSMVWKRLNDKNKNWRHVYKALVLLDYLVKTGNERVAQQCKENLFVIQSLRDFQCIEEAKDQGMNVREKAKQLVALLKDDEKLRTERASALRTRERLHHQQGGMMIPGGGGSRYHQPVGYRRSGSADFSTDYGGSGGGGVPRQKHQMRPESHHSGGGGVGGGTGGAEDVELEVALAISKEEHAAEIKRRETEGMKDDMRLKMAIEASRKDDEERRASLVGIQQKSDLLDTSLALSDPWGSSGQHQHQQQQAIAWSDPWSSASPAGNGAGAAGFSAASSSDPWGSASVVSPPSSASAAAAAPPAAFGGFDEAFGNAGGASAGDPWSSSAGGFGFGSSPTEQQQQQQYPPPRTKSAHSFLGDHGNLVDLDSLVIKPKVDPRQPYSVFGNTNPFAPGAAAAAISANPFHAGQPVQPTLAELKRRAHHQDLGGGGGGAAFQADGGGEGGGGLPPPLIKAPATQPPPAAAAAYPAAFNPWGPPPQPPPPPPPSQPPVHSMNVNHQNPFF